MLINIRELDAGIYTHACSDPLVHGESDSATIERANLYLILPTHIQKSWIVLNTLNTEHIIHRRSVQRVC